MTPTDSFVTHWYFHIPNLLLAAMIYSLIGRYVLELFFARKTDAVILNVFRQITDPVVRLVRHITPLVVPNGVVMAMAIVWLMALRLFLYLTLLAGGAKMSIGS